jgi:hypothetical protein
MPFQTVSKMRNGLFYAAAAGARKRLRGGCSTSSLGCVHRGFSGPPLYIVISCLGLQRRVGGMGAREGVI